MIVKVASNRLIVSSLSELYQQLFRGISSLQALGERLIHEAEIAQAFRQTEKLNEIGSMLSNLPLREYQLVGQYYLSWCLCRKREGTREKLEQIIENSTRYRARALIDLGTIEAGVGNFDTGLKHYAQAVKYASDIRALSQAMRSIAVVKGLEGFHKESWKDLERIGPIFKYSQPIENYQYLNSYAVELAELGRIEEAQNVCRIVLASPYAFAYPEWRETDREIALRGYKSRSVISVIQPVRENVLALPVAESSSNSVQEESAKVFSLLEWKDKMVKEPNGDDKDKIDLENATEKDLYLRLMELVAKRDLTTWQLSQVIDFVEKLSSKPDPNPKKG